MDNKQINIDQNTYYPSGNITIFPSANAVDNGKLFTEFNGRHITINITDLNYVVSPNPGGYDISYSAEDKKVNIQPGKAIINGFEVNTDTVIQYRLPTAEEITNEGYYSGYALLCLHTLFDALENLSGNIQVGDTWYCEGIRTEYVSYEDYNAKPNEYLLLGGVKEDGTVIINKDKYCRIDAKYILVKIEEDPETGAPPTQTTNLLEFINNFLKGYWVSKAGDNDYGDLIFKSEPEQYFEEGFDYKTEDPLNSTKFGIKIVKTGKTIVIKPENENAENMVLQHLPGIIGFYKGLYKGDINVAFDTYIEAKGNLPSDIYDKQNIIQIVTDGGAIKFKNKENGPILSIENSKSSHNGIEAGKLVYANSESSSIDDNDTTTRYTGTLNYLVDAKGRIKTVDMSTIDSITKQIYLDAKELQLLIETTDESDEKTPNIKLKKGDLVCDITLSDKKEEKGNNNSSWKNIAEIHDNVKITRKYDDDSLGSLQAEGFIFAGESENPATQQVPDFANVDGNRPLKSGDIFGKQVWSAVYNDLAEVFSINENLSFDDVNKLILAIDKNNPSECVLATSKKTNCVVGIVSSAPAFCCGSANYGVPVALAGRVEVKYKSKRLKIGDYIRPSNKYPGYAVKCSHNNKYRCGKVIRIFDDSTALVLVLL